MEPTIYKPSIYKGTGIYKTGASGGGGENDFELVFHTNFKNLSSGTDTPIIGQPYTTDCAKKTNLTPPTNSTTGGSVDSSPNGTKNIIDFTQYFNDKKKCVLSFTVYLNPYNSYCTGQISISGGTGVTFWNSSSKIKLNTGDTSIIKVPYIGSNPAVLERFIPYYTKDYWCNVKFYFDKENKKMQCYLYGILVYERSFNNANLKLTCQMYDGYEFIFSDVKLFTK